MLAGSRGCLGTLGTKWLLNPLARVAALEEDELEELELLDEDEEELLESSPLLDNRSSVSSSVSEVGAAAGVGAGAGVAGS